MNAKNPPLYTVGTLSYTQQALAVLFFWLMWNDFSLMLMESVGSLNVILLKNHGATNLEIASISSVGLIGLWINPVFSVWSDRHRSKWGRRRPFLFIVTPLFGLCLMTIPYMPDVYRYLMRFSWIARCLTHLPMDGPIFFIGMAMIITGLFNAMVLAIFSYLYWDVVPETVLGRFSSLSKIATALAGFIWSFFFYGMGESHSKGVYVGISLFCLTAYLISVWQIKEGEYPPPDPHKKGGTLAPVRAYFLECFSDSYYLWIFAGFLLFSISGCGGLYQFYYLHYDLKLDLDSIGKASSVPQLIIMALGFGVGTLADKLKPVRLMAPAYLALALVNLLSYFIVKDQWSFLICLTLLNLINFGIGVLYGALLPEIYPREKLGQFCSAAAASQSLIVALLGPCVGLLFDHIQYNRFGYIWSSFFQLLTAVVFVKVYFNWRRRKGHPPVPHSG